MKKRIIAALLVGAMATGLVACGNSSESSSKEQKTESKEDKKESGDKDKIIWAKDNSGNTFLAIAEKKGWLEEDGIEVEEAPFDATNDALTALCGGQLDIISNYGTNTPLQNIAAGEDLVIIGGYMAQGCMPIVAKKGTEWNGLEDLIGKKVADVQTDITITKPLLEKGYDPLNDIEWVEYPNYSDSLAAVLKGEVDYAVVGTSRNYEVAQNDGLEVMCYKSDNVPYYSCCRTVVTRKYLEENRDLLVKVMVDLLRGEQYYNANHDDALDIMVDYMGVDKAYCESYMNNEHFKISNDPLRNAVIDTWNTLDKTGFLPDTAKDINIEDHIDTSIYEEALAQCIEKYGDEDPEFWNGLKTFFDEHN